MPPKSAKKNRKPKKQTVPGFFKPGATVQYVDFAYGIQPGLTESTLGAGQIYLLSLNSIFDPDATGIGSVATGYGGYANFFTRYRVVSTRIQVSAAPYSSTGGAMIAGIMCGPNTSLSSTPRTWPVQTNAYSRLLHSVNPAIMFRHDRVIDIARVLGVTKSQFMTDLDYSSAFGTNPARQAYLILWVLGVGSAAASVSFDVRLTQHTELSQPLQNVVV